MNFHTNDPNKIKESINKEKEFLRKHILKLYGGDEKKAALDLFVVDEIFKRADQHEQEKSLTLIQALKEKYKRMEKTRKWAKHGYILSVILITLTALTFLLSLLPIIIAGISASVF